MTTTTDRLLTTDEAAEYLRLRPRTLIKWRRTGTGPRYVASGSKLVCYRASDLAAYVASRIVEPGETPTINRGGFGPRARSKRWSGAGAAVTEQQA